METEIQGQRAFNVHQKAKKAFENFTYNGLALGKCWSIIKEEKLYLILGFETFAQYVFNEFGYSYETAFKSINVYQNLVKKFHLKENEIKEIGIAKLDIITRRADEKNLDELLEKARALNKKDLMIELGIDGKEKYRQDKSVVKAEKLADYLESYILPHYKNIPDLMERKLEFAKQIITYYENSN